MQDDVLFNISEQTISVPYETAITSQLVKQYLQVFNTNTVTLPEKFSLTITNYISFLNGKPKPIVDRSQLRNCFDVESYFTDHPLHYFRYLMQQAFDNWTTLSLVIHGETNPDLQRGCTYIVLMSLFLKCVYIYGYRPSFFKECLLLNQNNKVKVNDDEIYNTKVVCTNDIMTYFRVYHTVNSKQVGFVKENEYFDSADPKSERQWFNNKRQGLWRLWYDNTQLTESGALYHVLASEGEYVNDKYQGLWRQWYDNQQHTLWSESEYVNDRREGHWVEYDINGIVTVDGYYIYGHKVPSCLLSL
jgi:hypothetical protein